MRKLPTIALIFVAAGAVGCATRTPQNVVAEAGPGQNQLVVEVAKFESDSPAGIAVSSAGRVFVTFPWLDRQPAVAVGELTPTGKTVPYPNAAWNDWDAQPGPSALRAIVSAQALTITQERGGEYLWVLDSGNPRQRGVIVAGPKLFKIDLADDTIAQVFYFDHQRDFAPDSLLSDLRVDPYTHTAYLSDAQRGGLYVVDLKQRQTRAVLTDHASTQPEPGVSPTSLQRSADSAAHDASRLGVAGLELSTDRRFLYYHALSGRTLYRVPTATLRDAKAGPQDVADAVENLGTTGSAMDGLMFNRATDELYMAALEHHAVFIRRATGNIETLVADERLRWPDSIAMGHDGYLYLTASARHLKRPFVRKPSNDEPGYVLKVSLNYLERAALAAFEAEEAQAAAAESQALADRAAARVSQARWAAVQEAKTSNALLVEVSKASQRVTERQFELAQAEEEAADLFVKQTHAAAQARADSQEARWQADASAEAAAVAEEAARVAALRAEEAQQELALTQQRFDALEKSEAEARLVGLVHQQALNDAADAWAQAAAARETADRLQQSAEAYQARAQVAADTWRAEAQYAQEFIVAAARAQQLAESADKSYEDAMLAEVRSAEPANETILYELADVPTDGQ